MLPPYLRLLKETSYFIILSQEFNWNDILGVPFGDIMSCESFLGIVAEVNKCVPGQHPKRPILGDNIVLTNFNGALTFYHYIYLLSVDFLLYLTLTKNFIH